MGPRSGLEAAGIKLLNFHDIKLSKGKLLIWWITYEESE